MTVCTVIPTYNRRAVVARAVQSVLEQTRPPDEIVVVDDGSADDTAVALRRRFGSRIEIVRQPNRGVAAARNAGVRATTADLIAFLDSDDRWHPRKLERQLPLMADPAVRLSATNWRRSDAAADAFSELRLPVVNEVLELPMERLTRPGGHALWTSTWIVRPRAFWNAGGFNEKLRVAEDTALLFQLALGGRFAVLPEVLAERSNVIDAWQLTNYRDSDYLREAARNASTILLELWPETAAYPREVRRRYERLLTYHLRRDLEYRAMDGRAAEARQRARQLIARRASAVETAIALAALLWPAAVGVRRRVSLALRGLNGAA